MMCDAMGPLMAREKLTRIEIATFPFMDNEAQRATIYRLRKLAGHKGADEDLVDGIHRAKHDGLVKKLQGGK